MRPVFLFVHVTFDINPIRILVLLRNVCVGTINVNRKKTFQTAFKKYLDEWFSNFWTFDKILTLSTIFFYKTSLSKYFYSQFMYTKIKPIIY